MSQYLLTGVPTMFDEGYGGKDQILSNLEKNLSLIPEGMRDTVFNYVVYGVSGGHFLEAVVMNNLKEAVARGDAASLAALADYVKFFYWAVPAECWGSEDRVMKWYAKAKGLYKRGGA